MGGRRKLAEHRLRRGRYPNQEEPHRALGRRRLCRCRPPYARAELRTQNRRLAERGVGGEGVVNAVPGMYTTDKLHAKLTMQHTVS